MLLRFRGTLNENILFFHITKKLLNAYKISQVYSSAISFDQIIPSKIYACSSRNVIDNKNMISGL